MASEYIVDVSESDFDYEVLAFSQNTPVIVEFWADWCRPCKRLSPILDQLVNDANGAFRLARVDVDSNPALAIRCSVHSLPTVQAFSNGVMVSSFVGSIPRTGEGISGRDHSAESGNLQVEKGKSLLAMGRLDAAQAAFQEALQLSPDHSGAVLGMLKIALLRGHIAEANQLFRNFPATREYDEAEKLQPLIKAMLDLQANCCPWNQP